MGNCLLLTPEPAHSNEATAGIGLLHGVSEFHFVLQKQVSFSREAV